MFINTSNIHTTYKFLGEEPWNKMELEINRLLLVLLLLLLLLLLLILLNKVPKIKKACHYIYFKCVL